MAMPPLRISFWYGVNDVIIAFVGVGIATAPLAKNGYDHTYAGALHIITVHTRKYEISYKFCGLPETKMNWNKTVLSTSSIAEEKKMKPCIFTTEAQ